MTFELHRCFPEPDGDGDCDLIAIFDTREEAEAARDEGNQASARDARKYGDRRAWHRIKEVPDDEDEA